MNENLIVKLQEKLKANYELLYKEWKQLTPLKIIDFADEIAVTKQIYKALSNYPFMENEAKYLLQFQTPLEVVSDYWYAQNNELFPDELEDTMKYIINKKFGMEDYDQVRPENELDQLNQSLESESPSLSQY